jgi:hypothetical protein
MIGRSEEDGWLGCRMTEVATRGVAKELSYTAGILMARNLEEKYKFESKHLISRRAG